MSSSRRRTIAGALNASGLPVVLGGMAVVSAVSLFLGARVLFDREGETAFPTVVAEYFWIAVWVLVTALAVLAVGWILFCLLARRFARPIARLTESAERAAVSNEMTALDQNQELDELHRLAVSFNRLLTERERKSEEIRSLSNCVLHDLRSPLVRIADTADRLSHDLIGKDEAAMTIQTLSRSLMRTVETNAEISRNYSGRDGAPAKKLDLAAIVRDVADVYEAAAEAKHIAFSCTTPDGPVLFEGHENKIQRLVGNLLDNAVKYTPEGGRISIALQTEGRHTVLEVSDTGSGIAKDEQPLIYERFYRCASAGNVAGTGLGLSMVRSIVAFYHGDIRCESAAGKGASFTVRLP